MHLIILITKNAVALDHLRQKMLKDSCNYYDNIKSFSHLRKDAGIWFRTNFVYNLIYRVCQSLKYKIFNFVLNFSLAFLEFLIGLLL